MCIYEHVSTSICVCYAGYGKLVGNSATIKTNLMLMHLMRNSVVKLYSPMWKGFAGFSDIIIRYLKIYSMKLWCSFISAPFFFSGNNNYSLLIFEKQCCFFFLRYKVSGCPFYLTLKI